MRTALHGSCRPLLERASVRSSIAPGTRGAVRAAPMLTYRPTRSARVALTLASLAFLACGGAEPADGGSQPPDGGSLRDAGVQDAPFDGGAVRDAGAVWDAGAVQDAGAVRDAGASDAALGCTAGDAGPRPAWDAGPDPAGYCRERALSWASDCSSCRWQLIADLCESEQVDLLAHVVSCLSRYGSGCPSFGDPGLSQASTCIRQSTFVLDPTGGRARCLAERITTACGGSSDYYHHGLIPMAAMSDARLDQLDQCVGETPTCSEARACYFDLFPGLAECGL